MRLDISPGAADDLRRLRQSDPKAWAAFAALIQEANANPRALDILTTYGNSDLGKQRVNVKPWARMQAQQQNLWRLRALDCAATGYRMVYGYYWPNGQLCVLAVVKKEEFNYDDSTSPIVIRIERDWQSLGK